MLTNKTPPDSLEARIVVATFRSASLLAKAGNRLAGSLGLTQQQWVLLAAIARGGREGVPLSALGRNLLVTKANITGMVDRLERDGYVARVPDPSDRRVTRAHLTPKGQRFLAEIRPRQSAWGDRTYRGFGRSEKKSLLELLEKQFNALNPEEETPWPASRPT